MTITTLGSGGGEGLPALFCDCAACRRAKERKGKDLRTLSQTLVNDDLLIDFGVNTFSQVRNGRLPLYGIEHMLITHTHLDHYAPFLFELRGGCFAHGQAETMTVYGSGAVKEKFDAVFSAYHIHDEVRAGIEFRVCKAFERMCVGRYTVTALPAKHAVTEEQAFNYLINDGKRKLLYMLDTGYPEETLTDRLRGQRADAVICDCTMGFFEVNTYPYHMNIAENVRLKEEWYAKDVISGDCVWVCSHFTHNSARTHEDTVNALVPHGMTAAFDGMRLEL